MCCRRAGGSARAGAAPPHASRRAPRSPRGQPGRRGGYPAPSLRGLVSAERRRAVGLVAGLPRACEPGASACSLPGGRAPTAGGAGAEPPRVSFSSLAGALGLPPRPSAAPYPACPPWHAAVRGARLALPHPAPPGSGWGAAVGRRGRPPRSPRGDGESGCRPRPSRLARPPAAGRLSAEGTGRARGVIREAVCCGCAGAWAPWRRWRRSWRAGEASEELGSAGPAGRGRAGGGRRRSRWRPGSDAGGGGGLRGRTPPHREAGGVAGPRLPAGPDRAGRLGRTRSETGFVPRLGARAPRPSRSGLPFVSPPTSLCLYGQ